MDKDELILAIEIVGLAFIASFIIVNIIKFSVEINSKLLDFALLILGFFTLVALVYFGG